MPCYTPPHSYCHHGIEDVDNMICEITEKIKEFDRTRKREEGEFQDIKKYADNLTDMLCRICEHENYEVIEMRLPDDILEWWEKHKQWDKDRKEKPK